MKRLLLLFLLASLPSFAQIALVQHAANESGSPTNVTTLSCSPTSPIPWSGSGQGHLIVVQTFNYGGGLVDSVTDNMGENYQSAFNSNNALFWSPALFY